MILTASYDFFDALLQKNPSSEDDVNNAAAKLNELVRLIRNLGILNWILTINRRPVKSPLRKNRKKKQKEERVN